MTEAVISLKVGEIGSLHPVSDEDKIAYAGMTGRRIGNRSFSIVFIEGNSMGLPVRPVFNLFFPENHDMIELGDYRMSVRHVCSTDITLRIVRVTE